MTDAFSSGTLAGAGSFRCESCGFALALHGIDELPACPECGGDRFRRAQLLHPPQPVEHHEDPGTPDWLQDARDEIEGDGDYLAFADGEAPRVVALEEGWTRIGRSLSADIRFDDPTVSRRHALVYSEPNGGTRILDDRSLNGVFRNGERVDLSALADGDRIAVGRFTLFFLHEGDSGSDRAPEPDSVVAG